MHANVNKVTDDGTSKLYVASSIAVKEQLSPCTRVFKDGNITITGGSPNVTLDRDIDVYGSFSFVGSPNIYIGQYKGTFTIHSGDSPRTIELQNLIIAPSGGFQLLNYNPSSPSSCLWNLHLTPSGGLLSLGNAARFRVDCSLNTTGSELVVGPSSDFSVAKTSHQTNVEFGRLDIKGKAKISGSAMSKVAAQSVFVEGTFNISNLNIASGWKSLVVRSTGTFEVSPIGWFGLDHFEVSGTFRARNPMKIRGFSQQNLPEVLVSQGGLLEIHSKNPNTILCDRAVFNDSDLSQSETSQLFTNKITLLGTWVSKKLSIKSGLQSLTVHDTGRFEFEPVDWISVNYFDIRGEFKTLNSMKMKGLDKPKTIVSVAARGKVNIETKLSASVCNGSGMLSTHDLIVNGTSIVRAEQVTISGVFQTSRMTIQSGWNYLEIKNSGSLQFNPVDAYSFDSVIINGTFRTLDAIRIKGLTSSKVRTILIGKYGKVYLETKTPDSVLCDKTKFLESDIIKSGASSVQASLVTISGSWNTKMLSISPGWEILNVSQTGAFQFHPIDWFSFDNLHVNGTFKALRGIKMKGFSQDKIASLTVGSHGSVSVSTDSKLTQCNNVKSYSNIIVNETTIVRADTVLISGHVFFQKLTSLPGWGRFTLQKSSSFQADPVGWFMFNVMTIDGSFRALNSIKMKGRNQEKITGISVGKYGYVNIQSKAPDKVICDQRNFSSVDFISSGISLVKASSVSIAGTWLAKKLSIAPGWSTLSIQKTGKFEFHPIDWFSLDNVYIDGTFHALDSIKMKGLSNAKISSISIGKTGTVTIDTKTSTASSCTGAGIQTTSNLIVKGISLLRADRVTVAGSFIVKKLTTLPGWGDFTLQDWASFQFDPVDMFYFNKIVIHGSFKSLNAIKIQGTSQLLVNSIYVGKNGTVQIQHQAPDIDLCDRHNFSTLDFVRTGISSVRSRQVNIAGTWTSRKLSINPGWSSLIIQQTGKFEFDPIDWFLFDSVQVDGSFHSLNSLKMKGLTGVKISSLSIGTFGSFVVDTKSSTAISCTGAGLPSAGDLIIEGTSLVRADKVTIGGRLILKKLSILPGWGDLTIQRKAIFQFNPIDWFEFNNIILYGSFKTLNSIKMRGTSQPKIRTITIDQYGILQIQSQATGHGIHDCLNFTSNECVERGISLVKATQVSIAGQWLSPKLAINPGWESLTIGKTGHFQFDPVNWYSFNNVNVQGNLRSLNSIRIKGCSRAKVLSISVADKGVMNIESKVPYKVICDRLNFSKVELINNGISLVQAHKVVIGGTWLVNKLAIRPGWESLTVQQTGRFQFEPVDWFSFDNVVVDGKLTVLDSMKMKGVTNAKVASISVGVKGTVDIATKPNSASSCVGTSQNTSVIVNGISIIKVIQVAIAGRWTIKKLTIKPGMASLTVKVTGRMDLNPVDWYNIDRIVVDGHLEVLSEILIKGLSKNKTTSIDVGSKGKVNIPSKQLSIILCDRVSNYGYVLIGYLRIGSGWQYLGVLGSSGTLIFNTDDPMPITSTLVSGFVKTTSPLGPLDPISGHQFVVEQPGRVYINHQGPSMGSGKGALNTTILMTGKFQIDGIFQAGSLYVDAVDVIVGSSGTIDVNAGGSLGASGPGAGVSSTSGASGASNGGRGGRGSGTLSRHLPYGDIFTIGKWGSGGGHGANGGGGGRGGGMVQFKVTNSFIVNGEIQMNGQDGQVR